jgi:ribosomal-protein-alanine N-acetyltransferase
MQQNTILQPSDMAKLHAQSGLEQRPWTAQEFAQLCAAENSLLIKQDYGFALGRVIHTEAELLLLIVSQAQRKARIGENLFAAF